MGKTSDKGRLDVSIGAPTEEMLILSQLSYILIDDNPDELTIKISGVKIQTNREAVIILEKIANSLFFEISKVKRIAVMLDVHREPLRLGRVISRQKSQGVKNITFPKYEYDTEPMNLYWYAQNAQQMPLLRFLAYYQVLEYYFPYYTNKEVQAEVGNILKEPEFDPDNNKDVNRVIKSVLSKMKRGYGDEKSQLLVTIKGCVQEEDILEILKRDNISKYFEQEYKQLSRYKITSNDKDTSLVSQLSERIYDIRCKIVHTKAEEVEIERILPFSRQEVFLEVENVVMEFISGKALIAGSKKMIVK